MSSIMKGLGNVREQKKGFKGRSEWDTGMPGHVPADWPTEPEEREDDERDYGPGNSFAVYLDGKLLGRLPGIPNSTDTRSLRVYRDFLAKHGGAGKWEVGVSGLKPDHNDIIKLVQQAKEARVKEQGIEPKSSEEGVAEGLADASVQDAIIDTVERLFHKNNLSDYGALEAIRQGVKHHFSKPGATAESAIEGILNILDKRMRKSGDFLDLGRFKEALRQGVAHQLKKQGVAEDLINQDSPESLAKHFAQLYYNGLSSADESKMAAYVYQQVIDGKMSIEKLKQHIAQLENEQGVAEGDKLQGTPVVSLKDFDDIKDFKKDKYGRTVPKKLEKDDPRVKFYKEPKKKGVAEGNVRSEFTASHQLWGSPIRHKISVIYSLPENPKIKLKKSMIVDAPTPADAKVKAKTELQRQNKHWIIRGAEIDTTQNESKKMSGILEGYSAGAAGGAGLGEGDVIDFPTDRMSGSLADRFKKSEYYSGDYTDDRPGFAKAFSEAFRFMRDYYFEKHDTDSLRPKEMEEVQRNSMSIAQKVFADAGLDYKHEIAEVVSNDGQDPIKKLVYSIKDRSGEVLKRFYTEKEALDYLENLDDKESYRIVVTRS